MRSVTDSGAGPPLRVLYLMPKSSSMPPGLWLAESTSPPSALRRRMTAETAGVERMPPRPTSRRPKPLAVAADDERLCAEAVGRVRADGVEDRLDEVLKVAGLHEDAGLLPQARGARALPLEGLRRDGLRAPLTHRSQGFPSHGLFLNWLDR